MSHVANTDSTFETDRQVIGIRVVLEGQHRRVLRSPVLEQIAQRLRFVIGRAVDSRLVGGIDAMTILTGADLTGLISNPIAFLNDALVIGAEQLMGYSPAGRHQAGE